MPSRLKEKPDTELMKAYVENGTNRAFDELYARHVDRIYAIALRNLRNETAAHDIVQSTFLRVHRYRNDFRLGAPFRPWVTTIALNLIRSRWRKEKHHSELDEGRAAAETKRDPLELAEQKKALYTALETIPRSQREVIELHWLEGMSFREIGEIVDAREGTVRVRAHRGYEALRKYFRSQDKLEGGEE